MPDWVDISITLLLEMSSELCEPRCKRIAHAHQVVTGESQQRRELYLPVAGACQGSCRPFHAADRVL